MSSQDILADYPDLEPEDLRAALDYAARALDHPVLAALARWIQEQPSDIQAVAVRDIGLRDASDPEIFAEARAAGAVVMTKDQDFIRLLEVQGPPPQVIWLRLGNSSTMALKQVLSTTLPQAVELLRQGEPCVEIRPRQIGST
jgi:predicted nuclease of predicted toxin-antitoxin system